MLITQNADLLSQIPPPEPTHPPWAGEPRCWGGTGAMECLCVDRDGHDLGHKRLLPEGLACHGRGGGGALGSVAEFAAPLGSVCHEGLEVLLPSGAGLGFG